MYNEMHLAYTLHVGGGWGLLRWWSPSTMWASPSIFSSTATWDVWIIPSFLIWDYVLDVGHYEWWPTSLSHSLSSLKSSLGPAERKLYLKITIPIFEVLQNFALPSCFPYTLFYRDIFSLFSSWVVITALDLFQSRVTFSSSSRYIADWLRVTISNDKST